MYRNSDNRIMHYIREKFFCRLTNKGIGSQSVLRAMKKVPRHMFVSEALRYNAYDDISLPIGFGQTVSKPSVIALMVQALELSGNERVLEIGTGSGYQSAILGELADSVVTTERISELSLRARKIVVSLGYSNIQFIHTDDFNEAAGMFDAVVVAAGAELFPVDLIKKLNTGGRIIIPIGSSSGHFIKKFVKRDESDIISEDIGEATFVPYVTGECA